jgi:heme-degrading monooxygenase HmoA
VVYIVWEFHVRPDRRGEFERAYSASGEWADLFRLSPAYKETILVRDIHAPDRYLLADVWETYEAFERFKGQHQAAYDSLDRRCEALTTSERRLGVFEELPMIRRSPQTDEDSF